MKACVMNVPSNMIFNIMNQKIILLGTQASLKMVPQVESMSMGHVDLEICLGMSLMILPV
jgi:hypothetical protein